MAFNLYELDAVHAVEVYNHNRAMAAIPDRADGAYMLDGLLESGRGVLANAGDDTHFGHPRDRFGGWVEVHCDRLDPEALLGAMCRSFRSPRTAPTVTLNVYSHVLPDMGDAAAGAMDAVLG